MCVYVCERVCLCTYKPTRTFILVAHCIFLIQLWWIGQKSIHAIDLHKQDARNALGQIAHSNWPQNLKLHTPASCKHLLTIWVLDNEGNLNCTAGTAQKRKPSKRREASWTFETTPSTESEQGFEVEKGLWDNWGSENSVCLWSGEPSLLQGSQLVLGNFLHVQRCSVIGYSLPRPKMLHANLSLIVK